MTRRESDRLVYWIAAIAQPLWTLGFAWLWVTGAGWWWGVVALACAYAAWFPVRRLVRFYQPEWKP
jgi:hypothetical protein